MVHKFPSMNEWGGDEAKLRTGVDPTKSAISQSALNSKYLCDYVVNVATGCRHGCKFCYVPSTPAVRTRPEMLEERADVQDPQGEWGNYVLYRDDLPTKLDDTLSRKRVWQETSKGQGIVGVSYSTDCYMDRRAAKITRQVIKVLTKHQKYTRIQTRNPKLALQDIDLFKNAGKFVTIGTSIPSPNSNHVSAIEPNAPLPDVRLSALKEFAEEGIQTFVSMSPTYPTMDKNDIRRLLNRVNEVNPSVIFHEPINPRGANFSMTVQAAEDSGEEDLAESLSQLRDRETWFEYSIKHLRWVQQIGEEQDLPIHLWPDKRLITEANGSTEDWLIHWRNRQSPEEFANRPKPETGMEELTGLAD